MLCGGIVASVFTCGNPLVVSGTLSAAWSIIQKFIMKYYDKFSTKFLQFLRYWRLSETKCRLFGIENSDIGAVVAAQYAKSS